ncbi:MAG: 4a-hydroxytetrahydrobiopterin dehydratase [Alteromonadaceae bacterium]|nr:4a-hydroxytetrahydrobiopterin dehydratase [Alteromonadaceae bacterium]
MAEKLSSTQIEAHLIELNTTIPEAEKWRVSDGKLHKVFVFTSFIRAFGWMSQMAIWAEKLNHHPEWSNVYNKVKVNLVTHDVDGISELDFKLANKMEQFK